MATKATGNEVGGPRRGMVPDVLGDVGQGTQTIVLHLHRTRREVLPLVSNADMRRYVKALKKEIAHKEGMIALIEKIMEESK